MIRPLLLIFLAVLAGCATSARTAVPPSPAPPAVVLPPPPPPMAVPLPPLSVCVVENGALTRVAAQYVAATGDTMVNGRRFSEAYPATAEYAAGASWYVDNEPITVSRRRYVKYGLPRVLGVHEVTRTAEYMGVPVFAENAEGAVQVVYVPVRPGCEFQPYMSHINVGEVRGE